jgi:hypothetical protein
MIEADDSEIPDDELIELVLKDINLDCILNPSSHHTNKNLLHEATKGFKYGS